MHKKLLIEAFEKAKRETGSKKITKWSEHISDFISTVDRDGYGEKILRIHYNKIKKDSEVHIELKAYVVDALLKYLGYDNLEDFLNENSLPDTDNKTNHKSSLKTNKAKTTVSSVFIAIFLAYFGYDVTKKDCMVWDDNKYEKVKCKRIKEISPITFDKVIYEKLKEVEPDCSYPFFNADGSENLWYGKSPKGELQFFTYHGLHPLTGKTLDPITQYMIDKYICK